MPWRFVEVRAVFHVESDAVAVILKRLIAGISKLGIGGVIGSNHIAHFYHGKMRAFIGVVVNIRRTEVKIKLSVVVEERRNVDIVKSVLSLARRRVIGIAGLSVLNIKVDCGFCLVQNLAVKIGAGAHFKSARRVVAYRDADLIGRSAYRTR